MNRWFRVGCALAGLGVILGAFGAHGLKGHIDPELLGAYETGVRYHLLHALALMVLGLVPPARVPLGGGGGETTVLGGGGGEMAIDISLAARGFVLGIALFSGSLYLLAITGVRILGAITPFGGLLLIASWGWLAWKVKPQD